MSTFVGNRVSEDEMNLVMVGRRKFGESGLELSTLESSGCWMCMCILGSSCDESVLEGW